MSKKPSRLIRIFSGHSGQAILSISALTISLCALIVSVIETNMVRNQQRAMVYPHLRLSVAYNDKGFYVSLENSGTGLALIQDAYFYTEDGVYFKDWNEIIDHLMQTEHDIGYNIYKTQTLFEKVIPPNETVRLFEVPWTEETHILGERITSIKTKICYSSILGDSWTINQNQSPVAGPCKSMKGQEFVK